MNNYKVYLKLEEKGINYIIKIKKDGDLVYHKIKCDLGMLKKLLESVCSNIHPTITDYIMSENGK